MVSLADGLFGLGGLVGGLLCWLALDSYRRWDEPGSASFAGFILVLGLGCIAAGVGSLLFGPTIGGGKLWAQMSLVTLFGWSVLWALFALQYTGRYTQVRWRTIGLAYLPSIGVLVTTIAVSQVVNVPQPVNQFIGGILFIYMFFLLGLGIYLLLQTTYRYGHLSLAQGLMLAAVPVVHILVVNTSNPVEMTVATTAGLYVLAYAVPALMLLGAVFRYRMFDATPAIGEMGERAIARETDDLLVVVDDSGRVIRVNDSAVELLDIDRPEVLGSPLPAVLGEETGTFRDRETVTLETTRGQSQYDSQVSTVTDQHGRKLGSLLSLRDVTERELREQRLSVLNRVLRHNLRNKIEVVRAHAEAIDGDHTEQHAASILAASDDIAGLGETARTIDRFVSTATETATLDIGQLVRETVEETEQPQSVTVSTSLPDTTTVETNRAALTAALESAIRNAVTYTDSRVQITVEHSAGGYRVRVADDGPGIPDSELDALDSGTEMSLQHGTGLGLWQLKWAVRTLGGALSFDTNDGTTVEMTIPNRAHERENVESAAQGHENVESAAHDPS